MVGSVACSEAEFQPLADEVGATSAALRAPNGAVAHLRGWSWNAITENLGAIRDTGFTAILISPHTATCGGGFSDGYDPSDLTSFTSRFGDEGALGHMVWSAHQAGIRVYADMVMNHLCASNYSYPRFTWNDFHHYGAIQDWNDAWQRENGDLFGLNDLAQESPYVRGELFNYLVKTNNLGIDGYRFDAAKHVPLWYWRDHVVNNVRSWGKLPFGEVYDANLQMLQSYVDAGMSVTDYNLYDAIQASFRMGGDLRRLDGAGYAAINGMAAITFVENHDVGAPPNRRLAQAFLAAYPGYPIFYNVYLRDGETANLVWIHKHLAHGRVINRIKEHDVLIFEREGHLLAGINQTGGWVRRWVDTAWRGTKLHDFSGNSGDVWTAGDGRVEVVIPPMGYVMLAPG